MTRLPPAELNPLFPPCPSRPTPPPPVPPPPPSSPPPHPLLPLNPPGTWAPPSPLRQLRRDVLWPALIPPLSVRLNGPARAAAAARAATLRPPLHPPIHGVDIKKTQEGNHVVFIHITCYDYYNCFFPLPLSDMLLNYVYVQVLGHKPSLLVLCSFLKKKEEKRKKPKPRRGRKRLLATKRSHFIGEMLWGETPNGSEHGRLLI